MQPALSPLPRLRPGQALWRGVVTALVVVLPAGVFQQLVAAEDGPAVATLVLFLVIFLGSGAGGWTVVRLAPDAPLWYAAASGALAYLVVQGLGVVRRLAVGEDLSWVAYPFQLLLLATCGMLGGLFARRSTRGADDDGQGTDRP